MKIYAITGGSGAGKSTVTYHLLDHHPDLFTCLHLDDFQSKKNAPTEHGFLNRDHPNSVNFDKLYEALKTLQQGKAIEVRTWDERLNPSHSKTREKITVTITPKPYLILEGFLTLHDKRIRALIDQSFFLDIDTDTRLGRRNKVNASDGYTQKILMPMHTQFVEPQKQYATHIIDVSDKTTDKISNFIFKQIKPF